MAVEYQYVGSNFTSVTGLFTTADRLSGDIILDAPLLPSSENAPKIHGFTFTDGVDTFSSSGFTYVSGSAATLSDSRATRFIGDDGFYTNEAGQLVEADFAIVFNGGQKGFNVSPGGQHCHIVCRFRANAARWNLDARRHGLAASIAVSEHQHNLFPQRHQAA